MTELHERTGLVVAEDEAGRPVFAGTCFAYRHPGYLLTAAHCVRDLPADRLSVTIYLNSSVERGLEVQSVSRHDSADIAILRCQGAEGLFEPFLGVNPDLGPGADVMAFGFPEDSLDEGVQPIPRTFRGFVQRVFEHQSKFGYRYVAAELGFGAPAGLSGGPVIVSRNWLEVAGVVAENVRASTFLETVTSVRDGGRDFREEIHSVINYAVVVDLGPIREWLESQVPEPAA